MMLRSANYALLLNLCLVALNACAATSTNDENLCLTRVMKEGSDYTFFEGSGNYQVAFNYTGENWTHADVAAIQVVTSKPIAILPMQYTEPGGMQPGAAVNGQSIGKLWNTITQSEMASRLRARGFVC